MEIKPGSELSDSQKHRDYTIITGKPKYGKSYLTKHVLMNLYSRVIILDRMGEYQGSEINDMDEIVEYISMHRIYRIVVTDITDERVDQILRIAWYFGRITVVIEEANIWFPSRGSLSEVKNDIILRSRHRAINLLFVSQRYRRLHIDLRSAYQEMYIFKQTNKKDIEELEADTGEELQEVRDYQVGEYFYTEN